MREEIKSMAYIADCRWENKFREDLKNDSFRKVVLHEFERMAQTSAMMSLIYGLEPVFNYDNYGYFLWGKTRDRSAKECSYTSLAWNAISSTIDDVEYRFVKEWEYQRFENMPKLLALYDQYLREVREVIFDKCF